MASAQVLRKKEHLEAGKRKLEDFRRKKAEEKAKKTASTVPPQATDVPHEKQPPETEHTRLTASNGVGTSDAFAEGRLESSSVVPNIENKEHDISIRSGSSSSTDTNAKLTIPERNNDVNSAVLEHEHVNNAEYRDNSASISLDGFGNAKDAFQNKKDDYGSSAQFASGVGNDNFLAYRVSPAQETSGSSHFMYHGLDNYPSNIVDGPKKDLSPVNFSTFSVFTSDFLPKTSLSEILPDKLGNSGHEDNSISSSPYPESLHSTSNMSDFAFGFRQSFPMFSDTAEKRSSGNADHMGSMNHSSPWTSDNRYTDSNFDARSSSTYAPLSPPAAGRRSRPSFLDSIQISRGPSSSPPLFGVEKADTSSSKVYPVDGLGSSVPHKSASSLVASGDGIGLVNPATENKHDFFSQKQNEDFSALEQHIEDLTQEKFSLQRALEASRALAESLASENSALTDSFNQQGSVVNQLKFELEKLQEEIKAQLVELEAVKIEYANAQLECNAADERAKLLASEVIGLEEKALRLRSNELKLERQLENTQAEISSYRKKMSSLEKDRQDLMSTIDALQEEKKLLQSKLRKASSSGKSIDLNKTSLPKKDMSTSTEDLDINTATESANSENSAASLLGDDALGSQFSHENIHLSPEGLPMGFPSDQIRMIQNINTLIAELAMEKDQLTQALSAESSQSSKLLELNKELTRKLEAQTQRLELLMAQSMANDNTQPRQVDPRTAQENMAYADEGDEVVEKVLGWIMKLFPGGPSRRRPSKHL